jgi:hypothetical protein
MQYFRILIVLVTVAFLAIPEEAAAKKKDEFADTRICIRLGLDTNHPLQKVCTGKAGKVDAARWTQEKESIHFVFQKGGDAFSSGHIKYKMDGGTAYEPKQLDVCVMEIPAFSGTEEEVNNRINKLAAEYYYAARDGGHDFSSGVKTFKFTERSKAGVFPESCDIVAATGDTWRKSWVKMIERISANSSPNSKFSREFKLGLTSSLSDLVLAFSVTPEQVTQGAVTAQTEGQKDEDKKQVLSVANAELMSSGSTTGLVFQVFDGSGNSLCHNHEDDDVALHVLKAHKQAVVQLREWGVTHANPYDSIEDIFQAALVGNCRAVMANPVDSLQLQEALATRSISASVGWATVEEEYLVAAVEQVAEAKRVAEIEAQEKAEQERLAAIEREKDRAERAERVRLAAIERAKTHPFRAIVSCTVQGSHIHVMSCFDDTELKVTMNNRARIYQAWEVTDAGQVVDNDLYIDLTEKYELMAQNGREGLTLGVIIMDRFDNVLIEDMAAQYGVVYVGNN